MALANERTQDFETGDVDVLCEMCDLAKDARSGDEDLLECDGCLRGGGVARGCSPGGTGTCSARHLR